MLRLSFQLDADLSVGPPSINVAQSAVYVLLSNSPVGQFENGFGVPNIIADPSGATLYAETGHGLGGPTVSEAGGNWDSAEFSGSHFTGTFHFDIGYDASLGGYGWALGLVAQSYAFGGTFASTDAGHTLGLESVTLPDGTPVAATFDSGLQLQSVPEPTSLMMLMCGIGIIGLLGCTWRGKATRGGLLIQEPIHSLDS